MSDDKDILSPLPPDPSPRLLLLARLIVGGTFAYMAVKKIAGEPGDFIKVINQYNLLPLDPPNLINGIGVILPWFELCVGLALMFGIHLRGAALSTALLFLVFTPAIAWRALNLPEYVSGAIPFTAIKFDCGCGAGEVVVWTKLAENTMLFFINLPVLIAALRRSSDAPPATEPGPAGSLSSS